MARQRNPRTVILDDLRMLNRWFRWATHSFTPSKLVWDKELKRSRPRTPADLIENNPDQLREFADNAEKAAAVLQQIAEFARASADLVDIQRQSNAGKDI